MLSSSVARLKPLVLFYSAAITTLTLSAQLVCYEGFGDYSAGIQVESGSNGSAGTGIDAGAGWGGAFDVNNAIKSLIRIEDRSANPVSYSNGEIAILGGNRALRFYDVANSGYAVRRQLGAVFSATAGDTLWFSVLFRTAAGGASPLANQDFFQIGFDDNENAASGVPRVSIGANTTQATFPSPYRFFARSTTAVSASAFYDDVSIAATTTYLLVGRVQAHEGIYDTVSLFVNPSKLGDPGPPSAELVLPSGLASLSHAFIRTVGLDNGDAYVLDEWHVARDYGSVVQSLKDTLKFFPATSPESPAALRWPASLNGVVLESSTTLAPESWVELPGPFALKGSERELPLPAEPLTVQRFFRLRR